MSNELDLTKNYTSITPVEEIPGEIKKAKEFGAELYFNGLIYAQTKDISQWLNFKEDSLQKMIDFTDGAVTLERPDVAFVTFLQKLNTAIEESGKTNFIDPNNLKGVGKIVYQRLRQKSLVDLVPELEA